MSKISAAIKPIKDTCIQGGKNGGHTSVSLLSSLPSLRPQNALTLPDTSDSVAFSEGNTWWGSGRCDIAVGHGKDS
eukprot:1372606-Amorphochlora_amoeboformis.AAC.1